MNVATLYELLDRLPEKCDDFVVRFTLHDRTEWVEPECWEIDGEGDLILTFWGHDADEDSDESEYTVATLKSLLYGDEDDDVVEWQDVYVLNKDYDEYTGESDSTYYDILNRRFSINWKRARVDVFIAYN